MSRDLWIKREWGGLYVCLIGRERPEKEEKMVFFVTVRY